MYSSWQWMICTNLAHELKDIDNMNNWGLWMIWTILGHELKVLDVMNSSGLWMKCTTIGHELRAQDSKFSFSKSSYIERVRLTTGVKWKKYVSRIPVELNHQPLKPFAGCLSTLTILSLDPPKFHQTSSYYHKFTQPFGQSTFQKLKTCIMFKMSQVCRS